MKTQCYMCDSEACSREHAPPLCIFPEGKDMGDGNDYRKNLIDDEYLQLIVIHGYFNNPVAQKQFKTKLTRAFSRRPALLAAFHSDNTPVTIDGIETSAVTIDRERFERSIEMLVRALYFNTYDQRLFMQLRIQSPLLLDMEEENSEKINELVKNFCLAVRTHLKAKEQFGENPDIFWFKIDHSKKRNLVSCHMQFYGGFDVFVTANET